MKLTSNAQLVSANTAPTTPQWPIINWIGERHVNSFWASQPFIHLDGNTIEERTRSLLESYGRHDYDNRNRLSEQYGYKTEFMVCLARAETSLGKAKKTNHNYFNCGNNDRWDTLTFSSLEHSFAQLNRLCLDGTFLRHKTTLSHLSPNHTESQCYMRWDIPQCRYVYASSPENWWNNMRNCLSMIHQEDIDFDYRFRREQ